MDSIDNFKNRISEIDILVHYAIHNISNLPKYQLFIKTSIVLLSTKFEVFLEEFIDEHSIRTLNGHTNTTLQRKLKERYFNRGIELISAETKQHKKEGLFQSISVLQQNDGNSIASISDIRPSITFNYGKHGQKEIESLFERHGLEVFIKSSNSQACLRKINSLIAIRNNVIHQDTSPGIPHQTIIEHKNNILEFINLLETEVESQKHTYYNE